MTMRMVSAARYVCDTCGTRVIGWADEFPEGWLQTWTPRTEENEGKPLDHICPACQLAGCVPPEESR